MSSQKLSFIKNDLFLLLKNITPLTASRWGKMNAQQMVEHLEAFFKLSSGQIQFDLVTAEEHLPKYREFLLSEKEFRENTKAPLSVIGEEPLPLQYSTYEEALVNLHKAVDDFETFFENSPQGKTMHPVFGDLNFDEWTLLHYKHITHHLKQFGAL